LWGVLPLVALAILAGGAGRRGHRFLRINLSTSWEFDFWAASAGWANPPARGIPRHGPGAHRRYLDGKPSFFEALQAQLELYPAQRAPAG